MKWLKRFQKPKPVWVVQLHCATSPNRKTGDHTPVIVSSWAPMEFRTERGAVEMARQLRRDNRWASANRFPHVTITRPEVRAQRETRQAR